MVFASESNIKFVFKKLKVRDLSDAEMEKYIGKNNVNQIVSSID